MKKVDGDGDGLLQDNEMHPFLSEMWGKEHAPPADWAKRYWRAMNAYNKEYQGIKAVDFIDCWYDFDKAALTMTEVKWTYKEEDWRKNNAENFHALMDDVTNDIKHFWKG